MKASYLSCMVKLAKTTRIRLFSADVKCRANPSLTKLSPKEQEARERKVRHRDYLRRG